MKKLLLTTLLMAPVFADGAVFNVTNETELQNALNTAASNAQSDVINLAPGVYETTDNGNQSFTYSTNENFSIVIDGAGAGATILDGNSTSAVLTIGSNSFGANVTVQDLTIREGVGTALFVLSMNELSLVGVEVTASTQTAASPLIMILPGGTTTLTGNTISNNQSIGTLMYVASPGTTTFSGNTFRANTTTSAGPVSGGVLNLSTGALTFSNNVFETNSATAAGFDGGIARVRNSSSTINAAGNTFRGNTVTSSGPVTGGVLRIVDATTVTLSTTALEDSQVNASGQPVEGGVLSVASGPSTITALLAEGSTVTGSDVSGGVLAVGSPRITLTSSILRLNNITATTDLDGATAFFSTTGPDGDVIVNGTAVLENEAIGPVNAAGGAFFVSAGDLVRFTSNTIAFNELRSASGPEGTGGGIHVNSSTTTELYNNIVWGNTAALGADILIASALTLTLVSNDYSSLLNVSGAAVTSSGNLNVDPMLSAIPGDFHLRTGSPMINAGTPAPPSQTPTDLDGQPRTLGPAPDIGADEFFAAAPQANNDSVTTAQNTPVNFNVLANDTDPNGDPITLVSTTDPAHGDVTCNFSTGDCTYTPDPGYAGPDSFQYTVTAAGATDTAFVSISVTQTSGSPAAQDDAATASGGTAVVNALTNDTDPENDPLTVTSYTQPANGTVTCTPAGVCTYTANTGFTGVDTFTYTVSDGTSSDTATVTITVAPAAIPTAGEWALLMLAALLGFVGVMRAR